MISDRTKVYAILLITVVKMLVLYSQQSTVNMMKFDSYNPKKFVSFINISATDKILLINVYCNKRLKSISAQGHPQLTYSIHQHI